MYNGGDGHTLVHAADEVGTGNKSPPLGVATEPAPRARTGRLRISTDCDLLRIDFGPRRSVSMTLAVSLWLAVLSLGTCGALYVLVAGHFGLWLWTAVTGWLAIFWTFGLRALVGNLFGRTRVLVTRDAILMDRSPFRRKSVVEFAREPSVWFRIVASTPPGWRGPYWFWGYGAWFLEVRTQTRSAVLLWGLCPDEARAVALALRNCGSSGEVQDELLT